jgi:hypothetical protein
MPSSVSVLVRCPFLIIPQRTTAGLTDCKLVHHFIEFGGFLKKKVTVNSIKSKVKSMN